jgi:hypothetical protein
MVAELARVRFFVAALKSGDSSYPKIKLVQNTCVLDSVLGACVWVELEHLENTCSDRTCFLFGNIPRFWPLPVQTLPGQTLPGQSRLFFRDFGNQSLYRSHFAADEKYIGNVDLFPGRPRGSDLHIT